jgi:hypothetical protein
MPAESRKNPPSDEKSVRQRQATVVNKELEFRRKITVDFKTNADFNENGRCPGHPFSPFYVDR